MHRESPLAIALRLAPSSDLALYRQIYHRVKDAMAQGALPIGTRIPSIRALAAELRVSRNTIEKAYELLCSEGLLHTQGAAGTTVARVPPNASMSPGSTQLAAGLAASPTLAGTPSLSGLACAGATTPVRPFELGLPALDAFPMRTWRSLGHSLPRRHAGLLSPHHDQGGLPQLRAAIAAYLQVSRGLPCAPRQVFVTQGYRHSLSLVCQLMLRRGDSVWLEDPVYPAGEQLLLRMGLQAVPVPTDDSGFDLDLAQQCCPQARAVLLTPANQSPLSTVLAPSRRQALLAWAQQNEGWIIEDDYDSEFSEAGRGMPTLSHLDRHGRVFYLGSFSKSLHPALRLAYVVCPVSQLDAFEDGCKDLLDGPAMAAQLALSSFLHEGHFLRHLRRMRRLYAQRRVMVSEVLARECAGALRVSDLSQGLGMLAWLPQHSQDTLVAKQAQDLGLAVAALSARTRVLTRPPALLMGYANFRHAHEVRQASKLLRSCLD